MLLADAVRRAYASAATVGSSMLVVVQAGNIGKSYGGALKSPSMWPS
jgi:hypothetical protein